MPLGLRCEGRLVAWDLRVSFAQAFVHPALGYAKLVLGAGAAAAVRVRVSVRIGLAGLLRRLDCIVGNFSC